MPKKDDIHDALERAGLNDKEATIYLMLLKLGTAPASTLGDRTDIPRSTAQFICQQLLKAKLVTKTEKGNTYLYTPEPPEKILYQVRRDRDDLEQTEQQLERVMGALKGMINPEARLPKVQFFEGKSGIIELYDKILELNAPIDSFEDKGEMAAFIPEYIPKFIEGRKNRKIFNRVICPDANAINESLAEEFRETRVLPTKDFPFTCDIKICKDLVSIFSFDEASAVGAAIRHKDIADNFRLLFEVLWKFIGQQSASQP